MTWIPVSALPFTGCVTLSKLLKFPEPQVFLSAKWERMDLTHAWLFAMSCLQKIQPGALEREWMRPLSPSPIRGHVSEIDKPPQGSRCSVFLSGSQHVIRQQVSVPSTVWATMTRTSRHSHQQHIDYKMHIRSLANALGLPGPGVCIFKDRSQVIRDPALRKPHF